MIVDVIVPFDDSGDPHRRAAFEHVTRRLAVKHPRWQIITGPGPAGEWSKGAAVADLVARSAADVLVIHDADSYVEPDQLDHLAALVAAGPREWAIPHATVYRLTEKETGRVLAGNIARRGHTIRTPYPAVPGGGITVLTRAAYDTVHGIDPRFVGWGGEDVAFGYALATLVGPAASGDSPLIHLWHPHPAPNLRGSPAAEALVADYAAAHGMRRRMARLVDRLPPIDPDPLEQPATFRLPRDSGRRSVRLASRTIPFPDRQFTTTDPDVADALRSHPHTIEVAAR